MQIFNKYHLPETVIYKGETYYNNTDIKHAKELNKTSMQTILQTLKKEGRKMILVKVLSRNLRGKTDLHGKPYQPTEWIFTTNHPDYNK